MKTTALAMLCLLLCATAADADVFRPAYLELRELDGGHYAVLWKVPAAGADQRLSAYVRFPAGTIEVTPPRTTRSPNAWTERWQVRHPDGFSGKSFAIEGNAIGVTDVIARLERLDGSSQVARLALEKPVFTIKPPQGRLAVGGSYLIIGVEHILGGIDHLLFVLALLLIIKSPRRLIATITAFTLAHSLTLAAATLGWIHVPGPPVEAMISLSIVFVAAEFIRSGEGRSGLTERAPWVVAFSFGLLHGFGFAGALAEVGLPDNALPLALFAFNIGVEIGQLIFVGAVLLLRAAAARVLLLRPSWLPTTVAYGIGSVAAYWTLERIGSFWA